MSRKELYKKKRYAIFACYRCRKWQCSNMFQKTHKCVGCGKRIQLEKVSTLHETDDLLEAIHFLKELKRRRSLHEGWLEFTSADQLLP